MRTAPALALATLSLLALVGCVRDDEPVIPDPLPSSTPIFASDEEALAAAEEAYAAYLAVSDQISGESGAGAQRIQALVSPAYFEELKTEFDRFAESGLHTSGTTKYDHAELQQYVDSLDGSGTLAIYVCVDVSDVRVLQASGSDVTPQDRVSKLPLEVVFLAEIEPQKLLLDSSEAWSGTNYCE